MTFNNNALKDEIEDRRMKMNTMEKKELSNSHIDHKLYHQYTIHY